MDEIGKHWQTIWTMVCHKHADLSPDGRLELALRSLLHAEGDAESPAEILAAVFREHTHSQEALARASARIFAPPRPGMWGRLAGATAAVRRWARQST